MVSSPNPPATGSKPLVAGSLLVALAALLFDFQGLSTLSGSPSAQAPDSSKPAADTCKNVVKEQASLSRQQLAKLLTIPERDTKARVRQMIDEPYCQLPILKIRSGVEAEREAYPLAFDPGTTVVVLYENDEYAGYRFSFE